MAYSVSLAEHGSLSVGCHWRLSRVYGGISRRNDMDSTEDMSSVSPCATILPLIVPRNFFDRVDHILCNILFMIAENIFKR